MTFPGARQQHLDRVDAVSQLKNVEVARLVYFDRQTFGIADDVQKNVQRVEGGYKAARKVLNDFKPSIIFCAGWFDLNVLIYIFLGVRRKVPICIMSESTVLEYDQNWI